MPEIYRAVIEMRFVEELSTKEIAAALGLKETTVNVRIHRGRALLMKKLRDEQNGRKKLPTNRQMGIKRA